MAQSGQPAGQQLSRTNQAPVPQLRREGRWQVDPPYLTGYDLFNEPRPGTTWEPGANRLTLRNRPHATSVRVSIVAQ